MLPAVETRFTNSVREAFETFDEVTPAGKVEKLNWTRPVAPEPANIDVSVPKLAEGLAEEM